MRKRQIFLCLSIILVAAATWWILVPSEPICEGKKLSEWLADLDDQKPGPASDAAKKAVVHIGTNGLPVIIDMLRAKDSTLKATFEQLVSKQSFIKFSFVPASERQRHGVLACYQLGHGAKPAIPALMELLNGGFTRGYVGAALGQIGAEGIVPLLTALTNQDSQVRTEVVVALGNMAVVAPGQQPPDMSPAIPALVSALQDSSPYVRALATRALGQIAEEESLVVPALIERLRDSDIQTQWNACLALGEFQDRATSAVPVLLEALHDGHADVRATAAVALVQIEPNNKPQIDALMPVLVENLEGIGGTNLNFRYKTTAVIGLCREQSKPAVPALLSIASSGQRYEQNTALEALKKIDPEAASKAGTK